MFVVDWSLLGMAAIVVLGTVIGVRLVSKMSQPCQLKWSLWYTCWFFGVLGIEVVFRWGREVRIQTVGADLVLFALISSPFIAWLNWEQIKAWGYENTVTTFYLHRLNGLIATWRNYVSSGGFVMVLWGIFLSSLWPLYTLLASAVGFHRHKDRDREV